MYEIFEQLLQKSNTTTYKVAKDTGISQTTFSNWKSGRSIPKMDKLQKIADYFGVGIEILMGWEEEKKTADILAEVYESKDIQLVVERYNVLSDIGKKRLKKYMELLIDEEKEND